MSTGDKITEGSRARCCWEVTAGIIPGTPIPELTRRWVITSEYWEKSNAMSDEQFAAVHPDGKSAFFTFRKEALEYTETLYDPRYHNWVRCEWIWF